MAVDGEAPHEQGKTTDGLERLFAMRSSVDTVCGTRHFRLFPVQGTARLHALWNAGRSLCFRTASLETESGPGTPQVA